MYGAETGSLNKSTFDQPISKQDSHKESYRVLKRLSQTKCYRLQSNIKKVNDRGTLYDRRYFK